MTNKKKLNQRYPPSIHKYQAPGRHLQNIYEHSVKRPNDVMGRAGMGSWAGTQGGRTGRVCVETE